MVKELYQVITREISLNITNGEIDSVRKKNLTKSGCRVYDCGYIGVSGVLGEPTEETWQAAQRALDAKIPYPAAPGENLTRSRSLGVFPEEGELIARVEGVLSTLRREFPEFVLSNKINVREETLRLENDLGLKLEDRQCKTVVSIVVKEESSPNVFDSGIFWVGREFDAAQVLENSRQILRAHLNPIPMPEEALPVLLFEDGIVGKLGESLDIRKLRNGASLLSGKEGTKIFSERFSLQVNRDETCYEPFFDAEGVTLPADRLPLIDNGVLCRPLTDKLCAAEYGAELTGTAKGDYDDVPTLYADQGNPSLCVASTGTLEQILNGRDAICVNIASGGDVTPAGDYATPVQAAYLYHAGKLTARLPEFQFSGNLFQLLGEGYMGRSSDRTPLGEACLALQGKISK